MKVTDPTRQSWYEGRGLTYEMAWFVAIVAVAAYFMFRLLASPPHSSTWRFLGPLLLASTICVFLALAFNTFRKIAWPRPVVQLDADGLSAQGAGSRGRT